jgi:hypothetical protein
VTSVRGAPARLAAHIAIGLLMVVMAASTALADSPIRGDIQVPVDHVLPGATFPIVGSRLDENVEVGLRLVNGSDVADLGRAQVAADGSLSTVVRLPESFPNGYATLTVSAAGGDQWSVYMLVGERPEGPGAQPAPGDGSTERNVAVVVLVLGLLVAAGAGLRYLRR